MSRFLEKMKGQGCRITCASCQGRRVRSSGDSCKLCRGRGWIDEPALTWWLSRELADVRDLWTLARRVRGMAAQAQRQADENRSAWQFALADMFAGEAAVLRAVGFALQTILHTPPEPPRPPAGVVAFSRRVWRWLRKGAA